MNENITIEARYGEGFQFLYPLVKGWIQGDEILIPSNEVVLFPDGHSISWEIFNTIRRIFKEHFGRNVEVDLSENVMSLSGFYEKKSRNETYKIFVVETTVKSVKNTAAILESLFKVSELTLIMNDWVFNHDSGFTKRKSAGKKMLTTIEYVGNTPYEFTRDVAGVDLQEVFKKWGEVVIIEKPQPLSWEKDDEFDENAYWDWLLNRDLC